GEWIELGLELEDYEFAAYCRWKGYQPNLGLNLEQLALEYYLDSSYPHKERIKMTRLDISKENLTGELDLGDFTNLEHLDCSYNRLNNIKGLNPEKIKILHLENNNFCSDLTHFSHLFNLEELKINDNRFSGSLRPLANLQKLKHLCINDTDINGGVEYLPDSLLNSRGGIVAYCFPKKK
ncbi:27980_t:CDS:1, partial [Racocetra persica]